MHFTYFTNKNIINYQVQIQKPVYFHFWISFYWIVRIFIKFMLEKWSLCAKFLDPPLGERALTENGTLVFMDDSYIVIWCSILPHEKSKFVSSSLSRWSLADLTPDSYWTYVHGNSRNQLLYTCSPCVWLSTIVVQYILAVPCTGTSWIELVSHIDRLYKVWER